MHSGLKGELVHTQIQLISFSRFLSEESSDVPFKKHTLSRWHREKFPSIPPHCAEKDWRGRGVVWFKNMRSAEFAVHWSFPPQIHKIHKPWFYTNPKQMVYRMHFFPRTYVSTTTGCNSCEALQTTTTRLVCWTDKTENYEEFEETSSGFFSACPTKQRSHTSPLRA